MFISLFLPSTDGQGSKQKHFNSQAEAQDSPRQTVLYDFNNKSSKEQIKDGNGTPLQYSCLENPTDRGAW